jgi:hypothetical protein
VTGTRRLVFSAMLARSKDRVAILGDVDVEQYRELVSTLCVYAAGG